MGTYLFFVYHSDDNLYIDDYGKINAFLTGIYGKPTSSGRTWSSNRFKDNPKDYGKALAAGQLKYQTSWDVGGEQIVHSLKLDDPLEIQHLLSFFSVWYFREFVLDQQQDSTF